MYATMGDTNGADTSTGAGGRTLVVAVGPLGAVVAGGAVEIGGSAAWGEAPPHDAATIASTAAPIRRGRLLIRTARTRQTLLLRPSAGSLSRMAGPRSERDDEAAGNRPVEEHLDEQEQDSFPASDPHSDWAGPGN